MSTETETPIVTVESVERWFHESFWLAKGTVRGMSAAVLVASTVEPSRERCLAAFRRRYGVGE